jgi:hypothetical protein
VGGAGLVTVDDNKTALELYCSDWRRKRMNRSNAVYLVLLTFLLIGLTGCIGAPESATATPLPLSPTPSVIPSQTHSLQISTALPTETAIVATEPPTNTPQPSATTLVTSTLVPTEPPTATCPTLLTGSFGSIWESNAALKASLGCPRSGHPRVVPEAWEVATAVQVFEDGFMIWSDHIGWYAQPVIYVVYGGNSYQRFDDTFNAAVDAVNGSETPPAGLSEPSMGFGKIWRTQPGVREALGWATSAESYSAGRFAMFTGGEMVWASETGVTYVFSAGGVTQVADGFNE